MPRKLFLCLLLSCLPLLAFCNGRITVGAERTSAYLPLLQGKRVALVVNPTSTIGNVHLLDSLLAIRVNVKKVFAPEHGFRGDADAGEHVANGIDTKTGIPIVSLYGKNRKPSAEQMKDIDIVVFDIQDVGARFYTYISTMHYVMEACAAQGKEFLLLDRPNPCDDIDGPVMQRQFSSFVGLDPIPLLHGCTMGELAQMINGEGWLETGKNSCRLTVITVKGWRHGQPYSLPVKPSPNLPNGQSIAFYPSLCLFEATQVSVGRGTPFPFQVIGAPDKRYGNFTFTPQALPGFDKNPLHKDRACHGIDLRNVQPPKGFTLKYFLDFYERSGEKTAFFDRPQWFDLLMGNSQVRKDILAGKNEAEIKARWQAELDAYKSMRKAYLLYEE